LGLVTVIGATFGSLPLSSRQNNASNTLLSQFSALKIWHDDPAGAQLNFLDPLRDRGSKSRTEQITIRGGLRLVATAAEQERECQWIQLKTLRCLGRCSFLAACL